MQGPHIRLDSVAELVVGAFDAAPAAAVAASLGLALGRGVAGRVSVDAGAEATRLDHVFDLASVTKPFVALTAARLSRNRSLFLREPLGEVLPELAPTPAGRVPIELLLAHRSGLAAHLELFAPLTRGEPFDRDAAITSAASALRPECVGELPREGFAPVYSDLGYILVGCAIERRAGCPLDEVVRREVLEPLGLLGRIGSVRQLRRERPDFDGHVVPTEIVPFRGGLVRGVVHDENAFALSGDGLSGHAGFFGEAEAVREFGRAVARAMQNESDWLGPSDLEPILRRRPGGTLLAGFDGRAVDAPSSGQRLGSRTFGHLGFTGTSLWVDPELDFVGVLLTNRVHPTREHVAIRKARPAAYDAMFDALRSER